VPGMREQVQNHLDLFLLLSLVLLILMYPVLDHGDLRKLTLGALLFVPVVLATVGWREKRVWYYRRSC